MSSTPTVIVEVRRDKVVFIAGDRQATVDGSFAPHPLGMSQEHRLGATMPKEMIDLIKKAQGRLQFNRSEQTTKMSFRIGSYAYRCLRECISPTVPLFRESVAA